MSVVHVDVVMGGRSYRFAAPAGQETRLKALAARVDALLTDLRQSDPNTDRDRLLVLACLQLTSDVADAHGKLDDQASAVTQFHRGLAERLEKLLPAEA
ncbi:MAG: cell division protein ZapA [Proteobacteria bacterium]|nr:cell division protein ZapA [Pseudomonadota bacterium]NBX85859.1 cell division protein ZapA [Pseudomonadota bacterium]